MDKIIRGRGFGWHHSKATKEKLRVAKLGLKNPQWTDTPTYGAVHNWLRKNFSKPNKCIFCGSNRFVEFALKKGYKHDHIRENYLDLCSSCHKKYDYTDERREKLSRALKGRKISWADKISKANKGRKPSKLAGIKASEYNLNNPRPRNKYGQFFKI